MERQERIIKKILIFICFGILFLPMLQNDLNLFEVRDLKGSFKTAPDIDFSFPYWFDGVFQENKEKYLAEHFGLRNTLVRLNNEVKFNFFKKNTNAEIVVGKENQLFAEAYIESYTGENFIGVDKIVKRCIAIKQLQEKMQAVGKIFLPVLAPNKARVLKDWLPGDVYVKSLSNYEAFVMCFKKLNIRYIDFDDYFIKNYRSSKYPLYSKYGVHWSSYGHTLAADSIVNYLNAVYHLNTPKLHWKENLILSDSLRELDNDAGEGLNLLRFQLPSEKMTYPRYAYSDTNNSKPPLLVIGDSYNFGIGYTGIQDHVFSNYKFLYYFRELMPRTEDKDAFLKLSLKDEISQHQVFLLIATEHNLKDYGWGFVEKALNIMNGKDESMVDDYTRDLKLTESSIRNDKNWYNDLLTKAFASKKNIDTVIVEAARYLTDKKYGKVKLTPLAEMIGTIKSDPKWMKDVALRAKDKNISVDSAVVLDAIWQLKQKH